MGVEILDATQDHRSNNFENLNIGGDFKLDEVLEEKETNDFRPQVKKASGHELAESKKLLKKIGNRMSEEEIKRKSELIIQISRFRDSSRFSSFLNSLGFNLSPTHLKSLDINELEDLIVELKASIQNKNGSKVLDEGYFMILSMLETITKHPRFNAYIDLNGLSQNARQSDELLDTLECLSLTYSDLGSLSPEKKLLFLTGGLMLRTSSVNKMLKNIKNYEEKLKAEVDLKSQQDKVQGTETSISASTSVVESDVKNRHQFNIIPEKQTTEINNIDNVMNKNIPIINFDVFNDNK